MCGCCCYYYIVLAHDKLRFPKSTHKLNNPGGMQFLKFQNQRDHLTQFFKGQTPKGGPSSNKIADLLITL